VCSSDLFILTGIVPVPTGTIKDTFLRLFVAILMPLSVVPFDPKWERTICYFSP